MYTYFNEISSNIKTARYAGVNRKYRYIINNILFLVSSIADCFIFVDDVSCFLFSVRRNNNVTSKPLKEC